jgi:hypothetical protein
MGFTASWSTLLTELEEISDGTTLVTPLSHDRFTISDVQEQRVIVRFQDRDIDPTQPLQREQFETLYERITDARGGFELDRLPPDADAYPAVWSLHPRFEINEEQGIIVERDGPTSSQVIDTTTTAQEDPSEAERTEPDLAVYADALLLIDALNATMWSISKKSKPTPSSTSTRCSLMSSGTPTTSDRMFAQCCSIACITTNQSPDSKAQSSGPPGGIGHSKTRMTYWRNWKRQASTASVSRVSIAAKSMKHSM